MRRRAYGQWDTVANPFRHPPARLWLEEVRRLGLSVVEPFCGTGALVRMLLEVNWGGFYDIDPRPQGGLAVEKRDTLASFPTTSAAGIPYGAVITNPPWLARRAASARRLKFWDGALYDDLYKESLAVALANVGWVAAVVPESFITSGLFLDRLHAVVSLPYDVFGGETEHPSCLALFTPSAGGAPAVWRGDVFLGELTGLLEHEVFALSKDALVKVRFNEPSGQIAVFALDSRTGPTIRFAVGDEVDAGRIKRSSRHVLRLNLNVPMEHGTVLQLVERANQVLAEFRRATCDVALTAARSRRRDGAFRRRLDFDKISRILTLALTRLEGRQGPAEARPLELRLLTARS